MLANQLRASVTATFCYFCYLARRGCRGKPPYQRLFERACNHLEWLLVGDRWKACGDFSDVNAFLDSLRLDQFRAVAETRKRIAERIKSLQPTVSNRQIARTLGVAHTTISRGGANAPTAEEDTKQSATSANGNGAFAPPPTLTGGAAARAAQKIALREDTDALKRNTALQRTHEVEFNAAALGKFASARI